MQHTFRNHGAWLGVVALGLAAGAPLTGAAPAAPAAPASAPAAPAATASATTAAFVLPGATLVPGASARVTIVSRAEEQVLLMALSLTPVKGPNTLLTDSLPTFSLPATQSTLIPLGEMARALHFQIDVLPLQGLAKGWFIRENRTFSFDAKTGVTVVNGREHLVDPRRFEVHDTDIFVDAKLFEEWFPVTLTIDRLGAALTALSKEVLPIEEYWARTYRWAKDAAQTRADMEAERKNYLPKSNPYQVVDVPFVDQTLQTSYANTGARNWSVTSTTLTSGDLLGLEHRAYLGLNNGTGKQHDFRITMGRRDAEGNLPFGATQILAGDVMGQGLDLVTGGGSGNGILFSNAPLTLPSRFDRRSFRGSLPPGWQVELFHNGGIVSLQTVRQDGIYEYLDVPILFGPNEYKLVFYGPQGQRREEIYRSDVNPSQIKRGEVRYQFLAQEPTYGERKAMLQTEFGLGEKFTLSTGVANLGIQGATEPGSLVNAAIERHTYGSLQLRSFTNFLASQVSLAGMDNGKLAGEVNLQSGYGVSRFSLRHGNYQEGFLSEAVRADQRGLKRLSQADATFFIPVPNLNAFSLGLGGTRSEYRNDRLVDSASLRLSTTVRGWYLSNSFNRNSTRFGLGPSQSSTTGDFILSRGMRGWNLRGSTNYGLGPGGRVNSLSAMADFYLPATSILQLGVSRNQIDRENLFTASFNKQEGRFSLGTDASYGRQAGFRVALNIHASFGREPRQGSWAMGSRSTTGNGGISALAFLDLNNNGVRDAGEPALERVGFQIDGSQVPVRTNAEGIAFIPDLPSSYMTYIRIDPATLEEPTWHSRHPGFKVPTRSGRVAQVELPVIALGELDGTVFGGSKDRRRSLAGLLVELVDANGVAVKQLRSAFDGYFIMSEIMPGTYTLRLNPEDTQKRGHTAGATRTIVVNAKGTLLDGQDLEATPNPVAPKAEVPVVPVVDQLTVPERTPETARTTQPEGWAIQVMAVSKADRVQKILAQLKGCEGNVLVMPVLGHASQRILLTGFTSRGAAETACARLPQGLLSHGNKPYVLHSSSLTPAPAVARR